MRISVMAMLVLLVAGCAAGGAQKAAGIRDADPATVNRECKLLGNVEARSLFGGSDTARAESAMNAAREKVAAMGGTHILFLKIDTSGMFSTGYATARAYRCDAKE